MKNNLVINNHLVAFDEIGHGPVSIIFLHGWRSSRLAFKKVISKLDPSLFRVFALDLPGFGESPAPKNPFNLQDYVDLIREFIKNKKLEKVVLVGHSFGGRIAIKLAADKPTLTHKVVLVDSAGMMPKNFKKNAMRKIAKVVKPIFKPSFMAPIKKSIYGAIGSQDYVETPELRETLVNLINEDLTLYLEKINQPTLIIWGEQDKETPIKDAQVMKEKIKNSNLVILKGAGHFSFLDQPEDFLKSLQKFIS